MPHFVQPTDLIQTYSVHCDKEQQKIFTLRRSVIKMVSDSDSEPQM